MTMLTLCPPVIPEVVVPLDALEIGEVIDKWLDLEPRQGRDDVVEGAIRLQVTLTELE